MRPRVGAASELEGGEHRRRLCPADARDTRELGGGHTQDRREPLLAKLRDDAAREIEDILSRPPRPQENGQKLRIAEHRRPMRQKPLARQLPVREVRERHRPLPP